MALIIGSGLKSSPAQGLVESSGDYWVMSYSRSLNQWASNTPEYSWVFKCSDVQTITTEMVFTGYNMPSHTYTDFTLNDISKSIQSIFPNPTKRFYKYQYGLC